MEHREFFLVNLISRGKYNYLNLPEVADKMLEFTNGSLSRINWLILKNALRQDGAEFPVEVNLSYFQTSDGGFLVNFVIDIMEIKPFPMSITREDIASRVGTATETVLCRILKMNIWLI